MIIDAGLQKISCAFLMPEYLGNLLEARLSAIEYCIPYYEANHSDVESEQADGVIFWDPDVTADRASYQ